MLWLLFIVPGLASLLGARVHRDALIGGFAAGVTVLLTVASVRLLGGLPIFDQGDPTVAPVLGVNRNPIAIMVLLVLPFLLAGQGPRLLKVIRLPLIGLIGVWMVVSGSRVGLVGLVFVGLVYALIQPGSSRKVRMLYALLAIGTVAVLSVQHFGGRWVQSTERLSQTISGESLPGDETRRLLARKAWHHAVDHPFVGIGFGRFQSTYDPVVDEGSSLRVRVYTYFSPTHNSYLALMAEGGFPTLILFVILMISLLRGAFAQRASVLVRVATCVVAGLLFVMLVEFVQDPLLYLTLALLLGAVSAAELPTVELLSATAETSRSDRS